ncbi:Glutaminase liver isoform, mitochondrial [Channa argus]|uniref:glutaminase n=1 Tax=Channa argus TaxID=215402 RepID=A0A6G1QU75_CHAAH|nr:Glutaminase liver isoform, mitochondrial [Channa argus]
MDNSQSQEVEDSSDLCFQRTPSLRRKWRKRYGGLDGNKLLEPNKEPDMKEDGGMTDESRQRSPENQETVPRPAPRSTIIQNQVQNPVQKPSSLISPGPARTTGATAITNGCLKPPLPQAVVQPEDRGSPPSQHWFPPQQSAAKRKVAADVLFDSFASDGRVNVNQFFEDREKESVDGAKWGVSICTVDGQRLSLGDWAGSLVLGEVSWPLVYAVAVDLLGSDLVHRYVGVEEYSRHDSPFTLTKTGIPHSPLTETGAIITTSLLQLGGRLCEDEEEKYDSVLNVIRRLCNKEFANLNCTSFQSSRKTSVRLHALSFYLQERKCSSTEVTCESGAAIAASLANGGLCPLSGDQTSIPAVSSSHGSLLAVVPGVLGLMAFSPEVDACGNPWRAVHFCQELISTFQLHSFDIRTPFRQILAYRQWKSESEGYQIMNVLLAAFKGDAQALRRYFLSGVDVNAVDYDGRSALHVAAAEGHTEVIRFLLENAGANPALKDRWGSSPLQEARRHNKEAAVQLLQESSHL